MRTSGGLAGWHEAPQDRRSLSIEDRDQGIEIQQDLAMMRRVHPAVRNVRHHVATSRRGLAVRRLSLRRDDGVAMTEFALIRPSFMVVVAGMLGGGRVFFYWSQANHVANETARWAIVDRNPYAPTTLQKAAADSSSSEFNSNTTVCITRQGDKDLGAPLKVTVAKPFTFVPILGIGKITIQASSTMRIERLTGLDASKKAIPGSYTEGCGT
jgi:Flp pilus assembly protein TadG